MSVDVNDSGSEEFELRVLSIIEKARQKAVGDRSGYSFLSPDDLEILLHQLRQDAILLGYCDH